jgi:hypothetical protein
VLPKKEKENWRIMCGGCEPYVRNSTWMLAFSVYEYVINLLLIPILSQSYKILFSVPISGQWVIMSWDRWTLFLQLLSNMATVFCFWPLFVNVCLTSLGSQVNAVGTETRLWAGRSTVWLQGGLWPNSRDRRVKHAPHHHLVSSLRMTGALPLI